MATNGPSSLRDSFVSCFQGPQGEVGTQQESLILNVKGLCIRPGERWALLGRNGAGKSTLCRVLSGLIEPSQGVIHRNGSVRALLDPGALIFPDLSGLENGRLIFDLLFSDRPDARRKLEEALSFSELGEHLQKPVRAYSSGMLTRLNLSLLSSYPADLLVLDEVFEGADQFWAQKMANRMMSLIEHSRALIFVSHSRRQVEKVCTKGLVISKGCLIFQGALAEAFSEYERPSFERPV